jgi:hypothetical protein
VWRQQHWCLDLQNSLAPDCPALNAAHLFRNFYSAQPQIDLARVVEAAFNCNFRAVHFCSPVLASTLLTHD